MGWFDWGRHDNAAARPGAPAPAAGQPAAGASEDERALERYRYMLRTAPPETIEQAHAEAFAQLTPEQRRMLLAQLAEGAPASERPVLERAAADPQTLARAATRAEMRQPGVLERMFGRAAPAQGMAPAAGMGMGGFGGMMAGSLLGSVAGTVLGSAIAHQFLSQPTHAQALSDMGLGPDSAHGTPPGSDDAQAADDSTSADADSSDIDLADSGLDSGGDFDGGSFDV
jgi:hypothetical protein